MILSDRHSKRWRGCMRYSGLSEIITKKTAPIFPLWTSITDELRNMEDSMERLEMLQNAMIWLEWSRSLKVTDSFTAFCALFMACVIGIRIIRDDHEHHQKCLKRQEASRLKATIKECMNRDDDDLAQMIWFRTGLQGSTTFGARPHKGAREHKGAQNKNPKGSPAKR